MTNDGYSIVRLADGVEIQHFPSNVAPPDVMTIPEASLAVHCPALGWQDDQERYRLVRRYRDWAAETRDLKLGPSNVVFDGEESLVDTCELAGRSEGEKAEWDAIHNPVPVELTNFRGRAILEIDGLSEVVEGAIAAIEDATERKLADMAYERGNFPRNSPLLNAVLKSPAVGMSDADIDDMYRRGQALDL